MRQGKGSMAVVLDVGRPSGLTHASRATPAPLQLCFALSPTSGEAATHAACAAVSAGCQSGSSTQRVVPAALKMAAGLPPLGAARVCLDAACETAQHLGSTAWGDAATAVDATARYAAACDAPARAFLSADMATFATRLEATPAAFVLHAVARLQSACLSLSCGSAPAACDAASAALRALPRAAQPAALRACARAVDTLRRGPGASCTDVAWGQLLAQLAVFAADAMAALVPASDAAITTACASCAAACLAAGAAAVRANAMSFARSVCNSAAAVVRHPAVMASPDALRVIAVAFAATTSAMCTGSDAATSSAADCAAIARDATQERAYAMMAASAASPEAADAVSAACAAAVALSDALWRGQQQPVDVVVRPLARAAAAWHSQCPAAHLERLATRYVRYIGASVSSSSDSLASQDDVTAACTAAPTMHALAVAEACATGGQALPGTVSAVAAAELGAWMAHGRAWSVPRCQALAHAATSDVSAPAVLHGAALMAQVQFLRASPGQAPAARDAADGAAAAFSACGAEAQHAHALVLGAVCCAEAGDGAAAFQGRAGGALTAVARASAADAPCDTWLTLLADVAAALGDSRTWQEATAALRLQKAPAHEGACLPATLLACLATAPHLPYSCDAAAPGDAADGLAEALSALRVADDGAAPTQPPVVDPSGEDSGDQTQPTGGTSSPVHAALVLLRRAGAAADARDCLTALANADAACRLLSPSQLRKAGGAHRWGVAGLYIATCACVAACAEACGFDTLAEHALADADSAAASLGLSAARGALHVRMASLRRRQHGWEAAEAACEAAETWLSPPTPAEAPCPELQLMRAELARVKGDIARRKPRSALAALRSADGGAGECYASAAAQAQALALTPGALGRVARRCVARAALGTAKCVAARCVADAAICDADSATAHTAALAAATPHLQVALAALNAPPLDSTAAGHVAHSDSAWDEAAVLVTAARLRAATRHAGGDDRTALCGGLANPAAPTLVATASRRAGGRAKAQPTAAAASTTPAVGPLLDRARGLASGAPCLLRAVCACVGAAKAREGSHQGCVQALHTALGAAACAEARYALATASMSGEGGAAFTDDVASAAEVLRSAEDSAGDPPSWHHLLAAPPLDTGAIVTLSVADADGVAFAGVPAGAPGARLVITRVDGGSAQPLVLCLPATALEAGHPLAWGAAELKAVLQESDACRVVATETEAQKRAWWAARLALDARLTGLCTAMDTHWLGAWRAALQGAPAVGSAQAAQTQLALRAGLARLPQASRGDAGVAAAMAVLARGAATGAASAQELARALGQLGVLPAHETAAVAADMLSAGATAPAKQPRGGATSRRAGAGRGGDSSSAGAAPSAPPSPVLLLLDSSLTALPWESMPGLAGQRISRVPSLGLLAVSLAARGGGGVGVDLRSAYFLLNPGGDLPATQARLQPLLSSQAGWDGVAGALPGGSKAQHAARLAASPLFLYFGHGAGTQFLPSSALRLRRCATTLALLMGCSSGALVPRGDFPPAGAALAYLAAGCASLVANLWDVTDKDIDRFAEALLHAWLQHAAADGGVQQGAQGTAVHTGLEDARRACKLRALTGAAPVCYGLPTLLLRGAGGTEASWNVR